ncbi:MAG: branched-chain amino acid ABC transporter permease [Paracoccus sp. (in: a-proteobacteria)]|nr:branched-chain amino acid ABC transporter permease [Paracoccus sp. (in: a-proteobacteria)]
MTGILLYLVFFLIVTLIYSIVVMGLNLQWGYTGLFNAGVVAFYAIGAYGTAILMGPPRPELIGGFALPFPVALIGGMAAAALGALIVGLAALRLRDDYLAIATFGIAISVQLVALNFDSLTGGAQGLIGLPRPLFGLFDGPNGFNMFYLGVVACMAGLVYVALQVALGSPWGRLLKAVREDEIAAASLGKNPAMVRLQAFVLGCALMGLAGGLYVGFIGFVSPLDFMPILTFQIWAMLIVGGSGNTRGAFVGAFAVWGLWSASGMAVSRLLPVEYQSQGGAIQTMVIGLLIVLTLLLRPRGLIGESETVSRHVD